MRAQLALLLLLVPVRGFAARFQTGQAARAVFGQSSFSAHDTGIRVSSLVVSRDKLYAADTSNRILTFDLSGVVDAHATPAPLSAGCAVCLAAPSASVNESVMPGVSTVSVWGKSVAVVDAANHRVLLWRDSTAPRPDRGPDLILGRSNPSSTGVGPSTLVNPVSVAVDGSRLFVGDAALHRVLVWNTLPMADDQPADAVLGQPDFYSGSSPETAAPDTIGSPAAMTSDGRNLFVADSAARRILIFSPVDQSLSADAVLNSASLLPGPLAPGTLITIRGSHLSSATQSSSPEQGAPYPDSLGGVQVVFDGRALPILSVAPDEVQTQLPFDLGVRASGALYLRVTHEDSVAVTAPVALKIVPASPGIFALGGQEPRPAILLRKTTPITEENPAEAGEVLTIWATGLGALAETGAGNQSAGRPSEESAAPVTPVAVQVDGQAATVLSAKLQPDAVGVYAIEVVIPQPIIAGDSRMRLAIVQNATVSNSVTFPVRSVAVAQ